MENFKQSVQETIDSEPFKSSDLKLLGIGAEKMVFETPGSTKKIIKVNVSYLKEKVKELLKREFSSLDNSGESDNYLKDIIAENKMIEQDISDVFGAEHLLKKGIFKAKIPITKDVVSKLFGEYEQAKPYIDKLDENNVYDVEAIIETQEVAEELKDPKGFETKDFHIPLIIGDKFREAKDVSSAFNLVNSLVYKNLLVHFDEETIDDKYVNIIKEIVTKIIQYTKKTGRMLDIFGPDNITIFTKKDGSLDYHLLDVVLPGRQDHWSHNIKDDDSGILLRHCYTFYYSIKSLGDKLGIADNLKPEDMLYFKGAGLPTNSAAFTQNQQVE